MKCSLCFKKALEVQQRAGNDLRSIAPVIESWLSPIVCNNAITIYNGNALCIDCFVITLGF